MNINFIEYVVVLPYPETNLMRMPLVLKNKPEYLAGMLNLPGGKVELGETPIEAAIRELKEETGLEHVSDYDGMCYCPAEYMGMIQGTKSYIHCVRVPVYSRQELKPRADETEEVDWYAYPGLLSIPNLMPNLRLTIPLMSRGIKGWVIGDIRDDWRKRVYHSVELTFNEIVDNPLQVNVPSIKYYEKEEEE
jgi:8-oxo-dGTP pyrophosphatase MutT (NUDIX family)